MTPLVDRTVVRQWRRLAGRIRGLRPHPRTPWYRRSMRIDHLLVRAVPTAILAIITASQPAVGLGLLAWWQLFGVLARAGAYQSGLGDRTRLMALRLLPVPDTRIAWNLTAAARRACLVTGIETAVVGAVAVLATGAPAWTWAGLPFAVAASAGMQMACAATAMCWWPRLPWEAAKVGAFAIGAVAMLLLFRAHRGDLSPWADLGLVATPAGWSLQILPRAAGSPPDAVRVLVGAVMAAIGIAAATAAVRALAQSFRVGPDRPEPDTAMVEPAAPAMAMMTPGPVAADARQASAALAAWRTAAARQPGIALATGPIGGVIARMPRTARWAVEILQPDPPLWWRRRRTLLLIGAGLLSLLAALRWVGTGWPLMMIIGAVVALLPFLGGTWSGADRRPLAHLPVGLSAFLMAVIVVNGIRLLTRLPMIAALMLMAFAAFPAAASHAAGAAIATLAAAVASVPFGAAVLLGQQTSLSDGTWTLTRLPMALALVCPVLVGVGGLLVTTAGGSMVQMILGACVAVACAAIVLGLVVLVVRRRWCDLV
ncbi:MAG: hypothetical protein RLZZ127_2245 [Planctomycetota bacterium]|jgi:hypothetical protein